MARHFPVPRYLLHLAGLAGSTSPTISNAAEVGAASNEQAATLSVSSNFETNGLVWAVRPDSDIHNFTTGTLRVYDATSLTRLNLLILTNPDNPSLPEYAMKMTPPLVVNGRVYVVTMSKQILVYGL